MKKRIILLFDFGHGIRLYTIGKHSPGYTIINGQKVYTLYEGEWVRETGRRIVKAFEELGYECIIIVPEDEDIPLLERCRRVNKIITDNPDADCYLISVHINAAASDGKWHDARGLSVWVSKKASQKSKDLAKCIYEAGEQLGLRGNRSVPKEKYWQANFTIITNTNCPAVLTENLFQDNKEDVDFLLSEEGKETIVNMHVAGICKFLGHPYGLIIK